MSKVTILLAASITMTIPEEINCLFEEIIPVLEFMESTNNPDAIGDNGDAKGILQIHNPAIIDVNTVYGSKYEHDSAFDIKISHLIFKAYMMIARTQIWNTEQREATEEDYVRAWNGGAYSGWERESTRLYWEKYRHERSRHYSICIFKCGDTKEHNQICLNCGSAILD